MPFNLNQLQEAQGTTNLVALFNKQLNSYNFEDWIQEELMFCLEEPSSRKPHLHLKWDHLSDSFYFDAFAVNHDNYLLASDVDSFKIKSLTNVSNAFNNIVDKINELGIRCYANFDIHDKLLSDALHKSQRPIVSTDMDFYFNIVIPEKDY